VEVPLKYWLSCTVRTALFSVVLLVLLVLSGLYCIKRCSTVSEQVFFVLSIPNWVRSALDSSQKEEGNYQALRRQQPAARTRATKLRRILPATKL
jgi:hypothetical protein